jgi:hypothetical protein
MNGQENGDTEEKHLKGFHYWPPKFNSKDLAFVFVLELFVLFLSLKQFLRELNIWLKA